MKVKTFKSLDEQIEILIEKGLKITDYEYTRNVLLRENYFFISGYRHVFLNSNVIRNYIDGTTFEELYALFLFDRQLRNIIFKNILVFENNLKSVLSYVMSKNHGFREQNYLNIKNFSSDSHKIKRISDLIRKMKRQISVNGKQHTATRHFIVNYGYIPLWVVVKVLSFGIVGELYTALKLEDQYEIADIFELEVEKLILYLPILANYRNLCAHEDICYQNKTQKYIDDTVYHHELYIPQNEGEYICGKNDLFALVIILKQVLNNDDFILFMNEVNYELDFLKGKLHTININRVLEKMGFPKNYKEIGRINKNGKK